MASEIRSLKRALRSIIWLNCLFCMGIFEIPTNHPRYFLSILYVISMFSGYFYMFYAELDLFQNMRDYEYFIFCAVLGVNVLVAIFAVILFWLKSENMNNIIKKNSLADSTLEALGIKREYEKTSRNVNWIIGFWLTIMVILSIMHMLWTYTEGYWFAIYSDICFFFPIVINSVVDITFASFIRCIKLKFKNTNILLNNVVLRASESNVFKIHNQHENTSIAIVRAHYKNHKDKIIHLMQTLRHLHLEITRIGKEINNTYCIQLLLELAVHFTIVTSTTYCLYGVFFGQLRTIVNDEKIVAMVVFGTVYSLKIILVNWLCTSVSEE
ncbi:uncharacterized protein LOC105422076, partial [Pogonomyrmex barbatus]|uniref:Gustatory receptor n=1 Tax=Pogonomyrmex barbatus TaxID=144034 RepID=A0A6I9VV58_9HYME